MGSCCSVRCDKKEEKPDLSTGEEGRKEDGQREGQKEREEEKAANPISHVVEDIVDAKHLKYMSRYITSDGRGEEKEKGNEREFWGIGIENETYLEWSIRRNVSDFRRLRPKRERYSADYYTSFSPGPLEKVLGTIRNLPDMTFPVWLNAHSFQKTDTRLCHRTRYDVAGTPDPAFTESIHDVLLRENPVYREMYDQSVVFDGDTIEFITQEFYCATVKDAVEELVRLKQRWLGAVAEPLAEWTRAVLPSSGVRSNGTWRFPQRNEGLVTFITTHQKNLSLCNNQTIHLNLTLPSLLSEDGVLVDKAGFMKEHLDWVSWIQVLEPLIVAVYGTPDVFSLVEGDGVGEEVGYSRGSLRVSRSRYISLQTYDVSAPLNGKLLLQPRPEDPLHWYNRLMGSGPYVGHTEIGYDVNVNKFKNHGIEVRFLDGVPEAYLPAILDMMVLLGAHSRAMGHGSSYKKDDYHGLILKCLRRGSAAELTRAEQARVWQDMGFQGGKEDRGGEEGVGPYPFLCRVVEELYRRYKDSDIVQKMSPGMRLPPLVCYHAQVASEMREGLYGKPVLVVRAEASVFEKRVALVPTDLAVLGEKYRIMVESSPIRCFPDEAYQSVGAEIVPAGSWIHYPHAWVVGLKGLKGGGGGGAHLPLPTQTLLHFAHCFKQQEGWRETLEGLGGCRFIDYEFMLDDTGKRTLSFCRQAGHVGALLGLLAYYQGAGGAGGVGGVGGPFSEEAILAVVEEVLPHHPLPRILLAGYGTVGKSVKAVLDQVGLACDVRWQSDGKGALRAEDILSYDIYFHAIQLHPTEPIAPFLTEEDIDRETERKRRLTLVVDLSCDMGHPWNPLPIYHRYGTREEPVQRIRNASFYVPATGAVQYKPPLDVLAVPYLPSFDPVRSSTEFSEELVWYLLEGRWLSVDPERNAMTRAMARAWKKTQQVRSALGVSRAVGT